MEEKVLKHIKTLLQMINDAIPNILELKYEEEQLKLFLFGNTGIKDAKGDDILEWKVIHVFDYKDNPIVFLSGFLGGLETIANFELLMQNQQVINRLKEDENEQ